MSFTCSNCSSRIKVLEKYAGRAGKCPQCQATVNDPQTTASQNWIVRALFQPLSERLCLKFAGFRHGLGTYLQIVHCIGTVPARLSAGPVSGCGARCERSVLAVYLGLCNENVSGRFRLVEFGGSVLNDFSGRCRRFAFQRRL